MTDPLWRVQQRRTRYPAFFAKLFFTWKKSGEDTRYPLFFAKLFFLPKKKRSEFEDGADFFAEHDGGSGESGGEE